MRELLVWTSVIGIFAAGFVLGANVMLLHAAALTRRMPVPKELLPRDVGAPLPSAPPSLPTASPFAPKAVRQPAKPATKAAFLEELNRRMIGSRRKEDGEAKPEEPDPLPPNIVRSVPPPANEWKDDPTQRKTSSRKW